MRIDTGISILLVKITGKTSIDASLHIYTLLYIILYIFIYNKYLFNSEIVLIYK